MTTPSSRMAVTLGLLFVGAATPSRAAQMTEAELCDLYLGVVEDAVAVFEPLWTDVSASVPNAGYFDFIKYDTWLPEWYASEITVCGNGQVVFCYALLLNHTDKATFTEKQVPRAVLREHAIQAIRWCCLTSGYVENPYPFPTEGMYPRRIKDGKYWIRPHGHRTDVLGWLTTGIAMLWDELDEETRGLVEDVMIGLAPKERIVRQWTFVQGGNHDVVKQDMGSTVGAAFLFPKRDDHSVYLDIVRGNGIDLVSTLQDQTCDAVAAGKAIREWSKGWNLYPDYSSDHHGWCQVWYGSDLIFEGRYYIEFLSRLMNIPVLETFTYPGNGFDGVLEWIKSTCLPEGEPASVHGMEYDAYYGAGLLGYCYGATIKQDPVAAALEEQAARQLVRHTRAIRLYDYHRNSWAKAAAAWLMHRYAGPRIEPVSFAEAWQALCGTYHYRWQQNLIHRDASKWASFTWGPLSGDKAGRPTAFVVPTRDLSPAMEPLVYLHTQSLVGETRFTPAEGEAKTPPAESIYQCTRTDVEYHTAGRVSDAALDRHYAFWSFPNGPCAMATVFRAKRAGRLSWSGQPVYFYVRPGITQSRTLTGKQGAQLLEETAVRKSSWWCVDDKLGMAVLGGERTIKVDRTPGFNWARTDAYRDKCDGVYVGPVDPVEVAPGDVPVDQTVAVLTGTAPDRVADVAKDLRTLDQPSADGSGLPLPEGWRCVVVTDPAQSGKRYLGVANLFGEQTHAHLNVGFDEGAPLGSYDATILQKTAAVTLSLANADSCAETIELYATVVVGKGVRARKLTHNRYRFCPLGQHPVRLRLTYTGAGAEAFVVCPTGDVSPRRIDAATLDSTASFEIEVSESTSVEISGKAYDDRIGPAVEIARIEILVNRQVIVEVTAADQSGIEAVELFCDGQSLGRSALAPYRWTHRPADGAHTYHAVAVDASGHANERASFRQTVTVAAP